MARYCFYCGRSLSAGERCHCKDPSGEGTYQSAEPVTHTGSSGGGSTYSYQTAGAGATTGATASADTATGTKAGFGSSAGAKARSATKTRHARASWNRKSSTFQDYLQKAGRMQQRIFRLHTFGDQVRTLFPNFSKSFTSGIQFITRPASKIRQESMRAKLPYSIFIIGVFSFLSGLLALLMSRSGSPLFSNLAALAFGSGQSVLFSHPWLSFAGLSVLAFLFIMSMGISFYVAARFSNRKPSFRKIIDLLSISLVYIIILELFIMITIFMGSRGSLSLLFVGLLLMGVTHLLSFRNALGLTEDTVFFFLIFVYIFCYLLLKFLLYLTVQLVVLL